MLQPMVRVEKDNSGLGDLEGAVMAALWANREMTTPMVHEVVGMPRGLAYTTILTTLQRLRKKGLLERVNQGRGHAYSPSVSRDEFIRERATGLASQLFDARGCGPGSSLKARVACAPRDTPPTAPASRGLGDEAALR